MKNIFNSSLCLLLVGAMSENAYAQTNIMKIKIAGGSYSDEIAIRFMPGATTGFDGCCDAWKLFSGNAAVPNLFSKTTNADAVAINALPPMSNSYTVNVFVKIGVDATYSVSSEEVGAFSPGTTIIMQDIITGQFYDLRSATTNSIYIPVTSSGAPARFSVVFTFPTILPIELTGFSAKKENNNVFLNWATATEENNDYFTIERGVVTNSNGNELEFTPIGTVQGAGNSSTIRHYEFIDNQPPSPWGEGSGVRYYRLKQTDFNGNYKYFGPVSTSTGNTQSGINVYPVVSKGEFTIYHLQNTIYDLSICNAVGQQVIAEKIENHTSYLLHPDLPGGIYFLNLITANEKFTQKIVITN